MKDSDTEFDHTNGAAVDPLYATLYGAEGPSEEAKRRLGRELLPKYDFNVVRIQSVSHNPMQDGTQRADTTLEIVEGPQGTVGRLVFGRLTLGVTPTKFAKPGQEEGDLKSDEELAKEYTKLRLTLNRVARVLGLPRATPTGPSDEETLAYLAQFNDIPADKLFIIGISQLSATKNREASNFIVWDSIAALDEEVEVKQGKETITMTAHQQAREELVKYAAKQEKKAAMGGGRTAGRVGGPSRPTNFFGRNK